MCSSGLAEGIPGTRRGLDGGLGCSGCNNPTVSRAQPTDRGLWPEGGPHRQLLEILDALREAGQPTPSFRSISLALAGRNLRGVVVFS